MPMLRASSAACVVVMMAGSMANGGGLMPGARPSASPTSVPAQACRVVPGETLETFYPVMPGWERGKPKTETDTQESVSRTTVDFDRDVSTISVEIMDSCRNPDVLLLMMDSLKQLPPAAAGTVVRHHTVNGFPGYEEWTAEAGNGEVHVLVAGRFMVKVTAHTTDLPTMENAARLIPMQKLAAVK